MGVLWRVVLVYASNESSLGLLVSMLLVDPGPGGQALVIVTRYGNCVLGYKAA